MLGCQDDHAGAFRHAARRYRRDHADPRLHRDEGPAPEAAAPNRGTGPRRAGDGRRRPLLHRHPDPDRRRPGGAGQGRARAARRARPPLRDERRGGRAGGQDRRAHGRRRSPHAPRLRGRAADRPAGSTPARGLSTEDPARRRARSRRELQNDSRSLQLRVLRPAAPHPSLCTTTVQGWTRGLDMGVFVHRAAAGVALVVVMVLAGAGAAQASWSGAGSLASGRYSHTATALKDGRVLVAGGYDDSALAGAQLYDPATNGWSNAAAMNDARHGHAAVLLHSGKVLVAGGHAPASNQPSGASGYTRTAEGYDPAANTWTKAASMSTGRFQPTMTVLQDGRVLVAGGTGDIENPGGGVTLAVPLASAEIYNPETNTWAAAAAMSTPRAGHTATLLQNGQVLVAGGAGLSSAELYDPSSNQWTATGALAQARAFATATELPDGNVLVAGGEGGARTALASVEVYDAGSGAWHAAAGMAGARENAAAALLDDGTVLVAGGEDSRLGTPLASTERYDPHGNAWTDGGAMAAARTEESLTALDDGRAIVVGGNAGGVRHGLVSVERFSSVTTTLTASTFDSEPVGTASPVVTSVLTNTGSRPLRLTGVSVAGANAGDFAVLSETCLAGPVAPGATCEVRMRFTPTAGGARSATLTVADNTAAGTTTAALTGSGIGPDAAPAAPDPGAPAPPPAGAAGTAPSAGAGAGAGQPAAAKPTGAGQAVGAKLATGTAVKSKSHGARRAVAHGSCTVKTRRSHGRKRSTVTCRVTWPTRGTVALRARLMRGKTVLLRARATARRGHAAVTLRPARSMRPGKYAVVITRSSGTVVLRSAIRVS